MRVTALLLVALLGGPAAAESPAIERATIALEKAARALSGAKSGRDRLAALGRAVEAHEVALAAYRKGLREMAAREAQLSRQIVEDSARVEEVLAALQSLTRAPRSALMAFPGGPVRAMRGAGMMAEIQPALEARIIGLRDQATALSEIRALQEAARIEARGALASLQDLRSQTAAALRSRREGQIAPRAELRAQAEAAARRATGLADLTASLEGAALTGPSPLVSFSEAKGLIPLPVQGNLTATFGEPDPWDRPGRGLTFEAPAFAQVRAPWDGTVRYAGPLIDYDLVVVLEPEEGTLIVLAGLGRTDLTVGEAVLAGEPLGDLGGPVPSSDDFLLEATTDRDAIGVERLYMELRRGGAAVDPAPWFDLTGGNGG